MIAEIFGLVFFVQKYRFVTVKWLSEIGLLKPILL